MGAAESKEDKEERERDEAVYDPRYISWDEHGNLRYGLVHPVKRSEQLKEILKKDYVDDEDGKVWYIMESAWIASWLAYVKFDRKAAPAPGPCNNRRLIIYDYNEKKYVGRPGLIMARKDFGGDYRRVSKEVWDLFCSYYPNSGPSITMVFELNEKNDRGMYDTSKWTILDPPASPEDAEVKKPKKKLFNLLKREASQKQEAKPTVDSEARDSTSLLSKTDTKQGTIDALPDTNEKVGDQTQRDADSDDDIDMAPSNSFTGKTKNAPKVVGLNLSYTKVNNEKNDSGKESRGKSDAMMEGVYFSKD